MQTEVVTTDSGGARTRIESLLHAYRQSQILIAAVQLGVFRELASGAATASELGRRLGVDGRRLRPVLDAACGLGLVERSGDRYANADAAARHLAVEGPGYLGNWIASEGPRSESWQRLADVVRGTRPAAGAPTPTESAAPDELPRPQQLSLQDIARASSDAVAAAVRSLRDPGTPTWVGDFGGGHGAYSIALLDRFEGWTAAVFDRPQTLELARARAAEAGVGDRLDTRAVDLREEVGVEGEIDLGLLFMVLVAMTPEEAPGLLRRVARAIRPGGWLVIRGFYWRDALEEAMFDLQSLMHHDACRAYPIAQVTAWLEENGFEDVRVLDAPEPERHTLLAARRSAEAR